MCQDNYYVTEGTSMHNFCWKGVPDHQTRLLVCAIFPSSFHPALSRPGTPKTQARDTPKAFPGCAQDPSRKNGTSPRGAVLPMRFLATSGEGFGGTSSLGFCGIGAAEGGEEGVRERNTPNSPALPASSASPDASTRSSTTLRGSRCTAPGGCPRRASACFSA